MLLYNKKIDINPIKKSTKKETIKHSFLFGSALFSITLAESAEFTDKASLTINQTGPITRKRSLSQGTTLASENMSSGLGNIIVPIKNENKKIKTTETSTRVIYIDSPSYRYQPMKSPYTKEEFLQRLQPFSGQYVKQTAYTGQFYIPPISPQHQYFAPYQYPPVSSQLLLQQMLPAPKEMPAQTVSVTPIKTTPDIVTVEMKESIGKMKIMLFSEQFNNMYLYDIRNYFTKKNDMSMLMKMALQAGKQANALVIDGNNLGNLKEKKLSQFLIQDAPFIKYIELFPNIKSITLANMNGITDHALHFLKYFEDLTTISINSCYKITDLSLANIFQKLNITTLKIINCKNISPDMNGSFSGDQLLELKDQFTQISVNQKAVIATSIPDTYHQTIDHMYQRLVIQPNKILAPTAFEQNIRSIFADPNYIKTIQFCPLEINFSIIFEHQYAQETVEQQNHLNQQKIENNTLLNLTLLYPNITNINLKGTHITDEGLWHLQKLPNLCYLDLTESNVHEGLQQIYWEKSRIIALFDYMTKKEYFINSRLDSYLNF